MANKEICYGDIYMVDFDPSVGHEYQKQRPAVVIQSNETLRNSSLVTVMPLTSKVNKKGIHDIHIQKTMQNCLYTDSIVKVSSIVSFDRSRFIKKVGMMEGAALQQIQTYLKRHFYD